MSFLTQAKTKRILAIHGWSGLCLGVLLYAVIVTGSVVVFEDEIDVWAQGAVTHRAGLPNRIDQHFRVAARQVDRQYYEEVSIYRLSTGNMRYLFHTHQSDPATGAIVEPAVRLTLDPNTGELIERWEGLRPDQPETPASALRDFWVDLHVRLHLPNPWGLILVGVLGLAMMAAVVSGVLLHRHIFRDAFVSAREIVRLVGQRDLHVLAGTWSLPFAFILSFTGAFFGFATTVGVPVMALIAFDGDRAAMIETVIGSPASRDLRQEPAASLDYIAADARARAGGEITHIQITNYDSASANVIVRAPASGGMLAPKVLTFDGPSRAYLGERPFFGQAPSLGATLFSLIGPLHFGNFAGLASKAVWFGMGAAMAYLAATGLLLWTKRREDVPLWRRFRHWIVVVIWGLPFAMLMSAAAFFVSLPAGDPHWWTPAGFLMGSFVAIGLGLWSEAPDQRLRLGVAVLCLGLPLLRHLTGGASWSEALLSGAWAILAIDVLILLIGLLILRAHRRIRREFAIPALPAPVREPAE